MDRVRQWMDSATPEQREAARKMAERKQRDRNAATPDADEQPVGIGEKGGTGASGRGGIGDRPGDAPRGSGPSVEDFRTKPVDARQKDPNRPGPGERVIADWYSDRPVDRTAAGSPTASEEIREAAQSAERASEQQVIPPRYRDLLKRVFNRYSQRAPGAPPAAPPER